MNDKEIKELMRTHLENIFSKEVTLILLDLWEVMQIWDDAEDGFDNDFSKGFEIAFIKLGTNPLYNQLGIPFLVSQVFYDWHAANTFERNNEELEKSYMLRAGWYRLLISLIHQIDGSERAKELSPFIYKLYGESFEEYKEGLNNA